MGCCQKVTCSRDEQSSKERISEWWLSATAGGGGHKTLSIISQNDLSVNFSQFGTVTLLADNTSISPLNPESSSHQSDYYCKCVYIYYINPPRLKLQNYNFASCFIWVWNFVSHTNRTNVTLRERGKYRRMEPKLCILNQVLLCW
jgi:hypothetical protein